MVLLRTLLVSLTGLILTVVRVAHMLARLAFVVATAQVVVIRVTYRFTVDELVRVVHPQQVMLEFTVVRVMSRTRVVI